MGQRCVARAQPDNLPHINAVELNGWVLAFTLLISIATGLFFGVVPAFSATRTRIDVQQALRDGGRSSTSGAGAHWLRAVLIVGQIALSLVLMIGAVLMIRSFMRLRGIDQGFRTDHVLTTRIGLPPAKYGDKLDVALFCDRLLDRVRVLPGVRAASATTFLPLTGSAFNNSFDIVGRPPVPNGTFELIRMIDWRYFETMNIPMVRGRAFDNRDRVDSPPVMIISESMARKYWPDENPIGRQMIIHMDDQRPPRQIAGIVRDVRTQLDSEPEPVMYLPQRQMPSRGMVLAVVTEGDPRLMIEPVRAAARGIDPDQPIYQVRTFNELLDELVVPWQFSMTLLGVLAGLALALASVGIFGVTSYVVSQRTQEIGIRLALGASRADILRFVLVRGMLIAVAGAALGIAGALGLTRYLAHQLYGVSATDGPTFAARSVVLLSVAFVANFVPARRAAKVDPIVALRWE
ncbi:MAG: FtsX-like permease family protein [Bryobacteraceae bacterium]